MARTVPTGNQAVAKPTECNPVESRPVAESPVDFERSLAELETVVERLEHGDLPLDDALKSFERGVALTRQCQGALKAAQQKVEILLNSSGNADPEPFTESAEAAPPSAE